METKGYRKLDMEGLAGWEKKTFKTNEKKLGDYNNLKENVYHTFACSNQHMNCTPEDQDNLLS